MHQLGNFAFTYFYKEMLGMKKIKTTFSFFVPLLFLSVLLAWPLSSEISLEASTLSMINGEHTSVDLEKGTFGNLHESARVVVLLAGTGIIGLACINRNKK
ncbi:hypothetical protein DSCW_50470 [Desulfosarcina widdelii]|uniref:Uncharacterized protein n=1 Tax=Desulfosarcina widdelii TaxID=947919 RepID=A0A5K7ZA18_9BACT|nr:hypothetical protein [Desulfosarcina widdelii]BBO77630.1 hypothetical protein DSCW_50470 [Desulfosarcina widdelii]